MVEHQHRLFVLMPKQQKSLEYQEQDPHPLLTIQKILGYTNNQNTFDLSAVLFGDHRVLK